MQKFKLRPPHHLTPYSKVNSQWVKGLNLRPEAITWLEESIAKMVQDIGPGKDFLNKTPEAQAKKEIDTVLHQAVSRE